MTANVVVAASSVLPYELAMELEQALGGDGEAVEKRNQAYMRSSRFRREHACLSTLRSRRPQDDSSELGAD